MSFARREKLVFLWRIQQYVIAARNYAPAMDSQNNPRPSFTVLDSGTILTVDGLALKHSDGVEIINVRLENRVEQMFYSWQVCRLVRRDFNFVASKLFHREKRKGGREQVQSLIHEVRLQADLLGDECRKFDESPAPVGRSVPIRLVSPAAASLFKAFQVADGAFARLNHAVESKQLPQNQVHSYTHTFEAAFSDLKLYCSARNQQEKSAIELAKAQGIV